ncbi:hypothetical protein [Furfurilactobacillus siliginis]|uniref:Uncharacterized protein n=1 Tax=Furfurilactobacillus siliginis TaxID=348151 RepID=A0A0R2L1U3_9LACO|nr:hypothetical protein [Furfurilactobacillus siliginis]KRN95424.1 hypothetical protein IV55_GL001882 [Furfurilactobacillus siliginis]GEK29668.1 hypothetical protein LSI01_19790 [Furfurilactobacillus siliginis]
MKEEPRTYADNYFSRGHQGLKIWQTLVVIFGWVLLVIPLVFVTGGLLQGWPHTIWQHAHNRSNILATIMILLFAFVLAGMFSITATLIQNRRRKRIVRQWPTFNLQTTTAKTDALEKYMTTKFGSEEERLNVRNYQVQPEQNLDTDTFQKIISAQNREAKKDAD